MTTKTKQEIEMLTFQLQRHEEIIIQLIDIIAMTNKRLLQALNN